MRNYIFKVEDYIIYILNKLEPDKSDKIKLNKVAFFVEFAFLLKNNKDLSEAQYAAIDKGPVIDGYSKILTSMEKKGRVKIDGYTIRPLEHLKAEIPKEICDFVDPLIKKYSSLNNPELIALSHSTDSYKITTNNEKRMGDIIDKKLAMLETFFEEDVVSEEKSEQNLPKVIKDNLVKYEPR